MGMTARLGLGFNQSYKSVYGARSSGVTYYNTTGRPMLIHVAMAGGGASTLSGYVNDLQISSHNSAAATQGIFNAIVPPGASYRVVAGLSIQVWVELSV